MIFTRRGIAIENYPSVLRHLEQYRAGLEPKPADWKPASKDDKWAGRKERTYAWYEIQDSVGHWQLLEQPKILYTDITWSSSFCVDNDGRYTNNTGYFLPTADPWLIAVLNAPVGWWYSWRKAQHGKDEALRYFGSFVESYPIPQPGVHGAHAAELVAVLAERSQTIRSADHALADWLRHEIGLPKLPAALAEASRLDSDHFVAAVRAGLPKKPGLTPSRLQRLRAAFADTAEPARLLRTAALADERALSDIVNRAYGLTPDDVALMWRTAPPRMPL